MMICSGLCAVGGVVALLTVRVAARVVPAPHPSPLLGCGHRRPLTASSEA